MACPVLILLSYPPQTGRNLLLYGLWREELTPPHPLFKHLPSILHLLISKGHPGALKVFLRRAGLDWIENIDLEDILLCHVFHNER